MSDDRIGESTPEERLARLERDYRAVVRQQRATLFALPVLGLCALLAGAAQNRSGDFDTLVAKELVIRDAAGKDRLRIGADPADDKGFAQSFLDKDGKLRLRLGMAATGGSGVRVLDETAVDRVGLGVSQDSKAVLTIGDKKTDRILLGTFPDGGASIEVRDQAGVDRIVSGTLADGSAVTHVNDRAGVMRVASSTLPDGRALSQIMDKANAVRYASVTLPDGHAVMEMFDPKKVRRYSMDAGPSGNLGAFLYDGAGRVRMEESVEPGGKYSRQVYDSQGKCRISTQATDGGATGFSVSDAQGAERILMATIANGTASQIINDPDGKPRLVLQSLGAGDRAASMMCLDKAGVIRSDNFTNDNGVGRVEYADSNGKVRAVVGRLVGGKTGLLILDASGNPMQDLSW